MTKPQFQLWSKIELVLQRCQYLSEGMDVLYAKLEAASQLFHFDQMNFTRLIKLAQLFIDHAMTFRLEPNQIQSLEQLQNIIDYVTSKDNGGYN